MPRRSWPGATNSCSTTIARLPRGARRRSRQVDPARGRRRSHRASAPRVPARRSSRADRQTRPSRARTATRQPPPAERSGDWKPAGTSFGFDYRPAGAPARASIDPTAPRTTRLQRPHPSLGDSSGAAVAEASKERRPCRVRKPGRLSLRTPQGSASVPRSLVNIQTARFGPKWMEQLWNRRGATGANVRLAKAGKMA